jgi:hypothetical protein
MGDATVDYLGKKMAATRVFSMAGYLAEKSVFAMVEYLETL